MVDQNQTYTSHASHQVFLREYALERSGDAVATGKMLEGANGGIPNWAEVKAQALAMLGIELNDFDVHDVPLLRTDQYGKFIPDPNGLRPGGHGAGRDGILNTSDHGRTAAADRDPDRGSSAPATPSSTTSRITQRRECSMPTNRMHAPKLQVQTADLVRGTRR